MYKMSEVQRQEQSPVIAYSILPEESQKIIVRRNLVYLQGPDLIDSNMKFKRRKKSVQ